MINNIWQKISDAGVSSAHPEENLLIRLYNQMSLVTALVFLAVIVTALVFEYDRFYLGLVTVSCAVYVLIIYLNSYQKIYTARLAIALLTMAWVCAISLFIGGFFSQSLVIGANCCVVFISFARRPKVRNILIFTMVVFYCSVLVYVQRNGPVFGVTDYPYDEILALFAAGAWVVAVLNAYNNQRNKLIADLQIKNEKLKETTEELERFTYIASHDLKSPLRTINSFIGLIERDIQRERYEALPDRLQFVKTGAKQINTLVKDILEISTLNNPEKKKKTFVDFNRVLNNVKNHLTEEISGAGAVIKSEMLPNFYCDEAEFFLVFQNLIQNGIKYNESQTPVIYISARTTDTDIIISFQDNGIGIEEEYHAQIFQYFRRLHSTAEYDGTGLGLGLCRKIINSYNGSIEVKSEYGKGSIFSINLAIGEPVLSQNAVAV